jgi:hypothetical protein
LCQQGAAHTGDDRGDERCGSEQPERQGEREVLCDAQRRSRYQPRDPRHASGLPSKALTRKYLAGMPDQRWTDLVAKDT